LFAQFNQLLEKESNQNDFTSGIIMKISDLFEVSFDIDRSFPRKILATIVAAELNHYDAKNNKVKVNSGTELIYQMLRKLKDINNL